MCLPHYARTKSRLSANQSQLWRKEKSRRLENAGQRLGPETGLESASTRHSMDAETPLGDASH